MHMYLMIMLWNW